MKKILLLSVTFLCLAVSCKTGKEVSNGLVQGSRGQDDFELGIAGFTYKHFPIDEALCYCESLGIQNLSIKNFWLPYSATDEDMEILKNKCAEHNVNPYILGPIYMKTQESVDNAFDYVKRFGHTMFIGVPAYDLLDYTIAKVKETGIKVAIHTHGPSDNPFPVIQDVVDRVKDPSLGVGCCIDLGHSVRYGNNVIEDILNYPEWIYDIHIKDESAASKEGDTIEMGRGVMDYKAIVLALREIGYKGVVSLEYEKDQSSPHAGVAESIGYFRAVCDCTK